MFLLENESLKNLPVLGGEWPSACRQRTVWFLFFFRKANTTKSSCFPAQGAIPNSFQLPVKPPKKKRGTSARPQGLVQDPWDRAPWAPGPFWQPPGFQSQAQGRQSPEPCAACSPAAESEQPNIREAKRLRHVAVVVKNRETPTWRKPWEMETRTKTCSFSGGLILTHT